MRIKASIMHKDTELAIIYVDEYDFVLSKTLVNIFPVRSNAELHKWWYARKTPYERYNMLDVYEYAGVRSLVDFVKVTHFASVNDCWWVKTKNNNNQNWSSINLFTNSFDYIASNLCILGGKAYSKGKYSVYSPEFSLGGSFPKTWRHINNSIYLYKGSKKIDTVELHNSFIYSELLANQLCNFLGISDIVEYNLGNYKGKDVCICKSFTSERVSFYPASYTLQGYPSYEVIKEQYGKYELFYQMCIIDCLLFNKDRHTGNYGLLVDSDSNRVFGMCPIFDNNYSLLPDLPVIGFTKADFMRLHSKVVSRFNEEPFYSIGLKVIRDYPKAKGYLEKAKDFSFKKVGDIDLNRLDTLTKIVRSQALYILSLDGKVGW